MSDSTQAPGRTSMQAPSGHVECAIRSAVDDEAFLLYAIARENNACSDVVVAQPDSTRYRVALTGGALAGFAAAAQSARGEELVCLFVFEQLRRNGIGRRLVTDVGDRLAGAGCRRLHVVAQPWSEPFFRRLGARRAGWRAAEGHGRWSCPDLVLELG